MTIPVIELLNKLETKYPNTEAIQHTLSSMGDTDSLALSLYANDRFYGFKIKAEEFVDVDKILEGVESELEKTDGLNIPSHLHVEVGEYCVKYYNDHGLWPNRWGNDGTVFDSNDILSLVNHFDLIEKVNKPEDGIDQLIASVTGDESDREFLNKQINDLESSGEFDNMDNFRVCIVGDEEQEIKFRKYEDEGCCGSWDSVFINDETGTEFKIGFNYGH